MEKRFLTYSRRTTRPNGGVDPNATKMRKEAKQTTMFGFTIEDGDAAGKLYNRSKALSQAAADKSEEMKRHLVSEEKSRQHDEWVMLDRCLAHRVKDTDAKSKKALTELEARLAANIEAAREKADAEMEVLERNLEKQRPTPVKYTPLVRDEIMYSVKLAKAQKYDLIAAAHKKLESAKREERERWFEHLQQRKEIAKKTLAARLQRDMDAVVERTEIIRNAFEKKIEKKKGQALLNVQHLKTDVERAFKREWHAMPEVAKSAKNSNKSRNKSSLTFAGSLLVDRQVGGKYDLPSLSQLHYEGESIRGVAADNDATLKMDFYAQHDAKKRAAARGGQGVRFSLPSLGTRGAATVSGAKMLAKSLDFNAEGDAEKLNASAPL